MRADVEDDIRTTTFAPLEQLAGGRKDDAGKDPWSLFPWDAAQDVVKVQKFGADKYGSRNWERGMDWSRLWDASLRHLTAWQRGEQCDADTGLSHLAHAACCVLFLAALERRGVGKDDRP